jgi:cytochrome c biogenesis protein CcmG/thiol:disulfide interchange protein DsbE
LSRRHLIYSALVVTVAGAIAAEALLDNGGGAAEAARPAPPLPSEVLVQPRATLSSLRGQPAAINFWASWCEPCRQEAPALERLARSLGRARLVGVNWEDDRSAALSFIRRYGWTFPNLRDTGGGAWVQHGVIGLPTTVVLDRSGRVTKVLRGPQTAADVARSLHDVAAR